MVKHQRAYPSAFLNKCYKERMVKVLYFMQIDNSVAQIYLKSKSLKNPIGKLTFSRDKKDVTSVNRGLQTQIIRKLSLKNIPW